MHLDLANEVRWYPLAGLWIDRMLVPFPRPPSWLPDDIFLADERLERIVEHLLNEDWFGDLQPPQPVRDVDLAEVSAAV